MPRSPLDWPAALALHREGCTYSAIARKYGLHYVTVSKRLRELGAKTHSSPAWHTVKGRRLYSAWRSMLARCKNPGDRAFQYYGGRGVRVALAWQRFRPFYEWATKTRYRLGQRIALVDESTDFGPGNCRWTSERVRRGPYEGRGPNSRATLVSAFGETKSVAEWARDPRCPVSRRALRYRLYAGVAPEAAIGTPVRSKWAPPLPKGKRPAVLKRTNAVTDWNAVLRLRKRGVPMKEIAAGLGISYHTIQSGLYTRFGPARRRPQPLSHDRRRLYQIWRSLRGRTSNPSHRLHRSNGALGVRLCKEWQEFEAFRAWALRSGWKPRLCLARVRSRGPYSPGNCKWVTRQEMRER